MKTMNKGYRQMLDKMESNQTTILAAVVSEANQKSSLPITEEPAAQDTNLTTPMLNQKLVQPEEPVAHNMSLHREAVQSNIPLTESVQPMTTVANSRPSPSI